jgi:hypothetical protein
MGDPAVLRKRIAELESENKRLKEAGESYGGGSGGYSSGTAKGLSTMRPSATGEKDWMNFGGAPLERPTTASSQNQKQVKDLQEELKIEKKERKYLMDEIEGLKRELQKSNFSAFTQTSSSISVSAGRLPSVPGVREITLEDIEVGEQIS